MPGAKKESDTTSSTTDDNKCKKRSRKRCEIKREKNVRVNPAIICFLKSLCPGAQVTLYLRSSINQGTNLATALSTTAILHPALLNGGITGCFLQVTSCAVLLSVCQLVGSPCAPCGSGFPGAFTAPGISSCSFIGAGFVPPGFLTTTATASCCGTFNLCATTATAGVAAGAATAVCNPLATQVAVFPLSEIVGVSGTVQIQPTNQFPAFCREGGCGGGFNGKSDSSSDF